MKLNLSDNKVIAVLLVALVLQILLLLWHMELIGPTPSGTDSRNGVVAGKIQNIENSLKRRPLDSLIWEDSQAPEQVYFHDSILTLSESTARIELKNGTQINLSENTLITIEPESESQSREIRIRMAQGNIKARNPYKKALIEDDATSVKIDADSDVDIAKSEDGRVEILVNKGKVDIEHQEESFAIGKNERMVLTDQGAKKDKMSDNLIWKSEELVRQYTHLQEAFVSFDWQGEAKKLYIEKKGEVFKELPLQKKPLSIALPLGHYQAYLVGAGGRTKSLEVQVWRAPKIQLVQPRPRDRKPTGAMQFVWTPDQNMDSYELVLKGQKKTLRFPAALNKTQETVDVEGDFQWEVWGIDKKGYRVPPAYTYPLFIRENPFAPPKLKKPKIIKKNKSAWLEGWWSLFVAKAYADQPEAVFSWEPVPGAEVYFIEICKDQEFRQPVVQEKLTAPLYRWKQFDERQTYYWRVAAGDQSGRMGVFSEPTEVDWDYVLPEKPMPKPKPVVRKTERPKKKPQLSRPTTPVTKPVATQAPAPIEAPPQSEVMEPRQIFESFSLFYLPSFGLKNYKEGGQTKASLDGVSLISAAFEIELWITRQSLLRWYSKFNQVEYEPQPKSAFPFQPNISTRTWVNHLLWSPKSSTWGFGINVSELPSLKRQSFEQVSIEQQIAYGLTVEKKLQRESWQWIATLSLLNSQSQVGGGTSQRVLVPLVFEGLRVGAEAEVLYLGESENSDLMVDFYLILGWQF